jgi:hypothetical protein
MDRARYNLFTQAYPANLVNLVHAALTNYVHDQLMMPDHLITIPQFATKFKGLLKNRNPDWQKLLPTRIAQALMPAIDSAGTMWRPCPFTVQPYHRVHDSVRILLDYWLICRPKLCTSPSNFQGQWRAQKN